MVRFQYDHNIGQWRWHFSKNSEKLDEKILDTIRNAFGSNEFTYATIGNDDFAYMSSLQAEGNTILQGTVVGVKGKFTDLPQKPSCYVGKWGKYDLIQGTDIPDCKFPAPDTSDFDSYPGDFGNILDAIMFGTKKVVIIVQDNREALDCIKAINYILPTDYAKRIGFSVGTNKIPETSVNVVSESGKTIPINVKVFFATADKVNPSSQSYYVFDAFPDEPTNNYKSELSEFAKVVNDFCMDSESKMKEFIKLILPAFENNGKLDKEMLKRLSLFFRFYADPDDKTAKELVEAGIGNGTDEIQRKGFLVACNHFWRNSNVALLAEESRIKMAEAYNTDTSIFNENNAVNYFKYLISQDSLTQVEKNVLIDIAANRGCIANASHVLFCNPDFRARDTVFEILTNMLQKNSNIYSCEELIKQAIEYFNINNCYAVLASTGEIDDGELIFSRTKNIADKEVKFLICAILMASCLTTTSSAYSPHTRIRFNGLLRMMNESKMTPIEQIACVIKVHNKLGDIANLDDFELNDISYFLCDKANSSDAPDWTQWIKETVSSLSITQLVDMENVLINSDYIGLKEIVERKLLDIEYIGPELRRNEGVRPDYIRIFNMLNNDNQYRHISEYLRNLKNEKIVEGKFLDIRWGFLKDAYDTINNAEKKIGEMSPIATDYRLEKQNDIADKIQAEFRGAASSGKGRFFNVFLPIINLIIWAFGAFIIMYLCNNIAQGLFMKDHSSIVTNFMILPAISAVASALFYQYNRGINLLFRNIVTAIETVIFLIIMLSAFYGSVSVVGLIF